MQYHNFKPKLHRDDFGWHSRQNLPHLDAETRTQFVTFRLYDSMPQSLFDEWRGDRYIRNRRHFNAVVKYIEMNPVKAGLCGKPEEWKFGSAYERALPLDT